MISLVFLGTSSGIPTLERNVSSIALVNENKSIWLFDCGDGTQIQMLRKGLVFHRITTVFITHLHGDHCYGLPGLLGMLSMRKVSHKITIVAPKGVKDMLNTIALHSQLYYSYPLEIIELESSTNLGIFGNFEVFARKLKHRVPCFGYVLRELPMKGLFSSEIALKLGVPRGPILGALAKSSISQVTTDSGKIIHRDECLEPPILGRKVTILGDTCDSSEIEEIAAQSDILIHETTFDSSLATLVEKTGHSTTKMAAEFAQKISAKKLIISHFSARYGNENQRGSHNKNNNDDHDGDNGVSYLTVNDLLKETQQFCGDKIEVSSKTLHYAF